MTVTSAQQNHACLIVTGSALVSSRTCVSLRHTSQSVLIDLCTGAYSSTSRGGRSTPLTRSLSSWSLRQGSSDAFKRAGARMRSTLQSTLILPTAISPETGLQRGWLITAAYGRGFPFDLWGKFCKQTRVDYNNWSPWSCHLEKV